MWEAYAEYSDGSTICVKLPYAENGNYASENERQFCIEEWLIGRHPGCTFYSVCYVE